MPSALCLIVLCAAGGLPQDEPLGDPDAAAGPAAAAAAARLGAADSAVRREAVEALVALGPAARGVVPGLLERLSTAPELDLSAPPRNEGTASVSELLRVIRTVRADAVPAVAAAVRSDDPAVAAAGVRVAGDFALFSRRSGPGAEEARLIVAALRGPLLARLPTLPPDRWRANWQAAADALERARPGGRLSGGAGRGGAERPGGAGRTEAADAAALTAFLVETLGDEDPRARWAAAETLHALGPAAAAAAGPLRTTLVGDPSPSVRGAAAGALVALRPAGAERDAAVAALTAASREAVALRPKLSRRRQDRDVLGAAAAAGLLTLVREDPRRHDAVAADAVRALRDLIPPGGPAPRLFEEMLVEDLAALAALTPGHAAAAAELLADRLPAPRPAAGSGPFLSSHFPYDALAALGPPAADAAGASLAALLAHPDPGVRAGAAEALVAVAPDAPGLIDAVRELIERTEPGTSAPDSDPSRRALAAVARLGGRAEPLLPAVLARLEVEGTWGDPSPNEDAFRAVAALGPRAAAAVPVLARHLGHYRPEDVTAALTAIGPAALEPVAAVAAEPRADRPVALGPFEPWQADRRGALSTLGRFGPAAAPHSGPLLAAAADPAERGRPGLLDAVAELNVPDLSVPALLAAATDADPLVRAAVARGLRRFPDDLPRTRDALHALAADKYATVRLPAAVTLRVLAPADAVLNGLKTDPNPAVRIAAE